MNEEALAHWGLLRQRQTNKQTDRLHANFEGLLYSLLSQGLCIEAYLLSPRFVLRSEQDISPE
jgi:hypothetical protein